MEQKLIERIPVDDRRLSGIALPKYGDYAGYSEPHTMEECPFKPDSREYAKMNR